MKKETEKIIKKEFGDIFMSPQDIISKKRVIIPTSPKLDISLSGGVVTGSSVLISGKPKLGKTSLALQICANAQKKEYGSRHCYYLDVEGRLEKKNLTGIKELNLDKITVVKSTEGNILSGEKFLNIADKIIKSEPDCVIVLDSTSALCSESEMTSDVSGDIRSKTPKMLASFMRKISNIIPIQNTLLIMINHVIANTAGTMFSPSVVTDSGNKICYGSNTKLLGRSFKKWEEEGKQIGQIINWYVEYSDLGPPGSSCESYVRYNFGVDYIWETIDLACDLGLIEKGGAWYSLIFLEQSIKIQGQKKVWEHLLKNKEDLVLLNEKIKELV